MNDHHPIDPDHSTGLTRRKIVTAAAWSVPAIAFAAAAPSASASTTTPVCRTVNFTAPTPTRFGRDNNAAITTQFQVPAGVTSIEFTVAGGAGGGGGRAGSGGLLMGTLAVAAGEMLTLVVGQGGWAHPLDTGAAPVQTRPAVPGGQGYGNGGSLPAASGSFDGALVATTQGGSGGGASAILSGGTPLVVAGGGGGRGNAVYEVADWEFTALAYGGSAGYPNSAVANVLKRVGRNGQISGGRGLGASGATQGSGGVGTSNISTAVTAAGDSGSGRDGGNGDLIGRGNDIPMISGATFLRTVSGAGGGGYAGGGAGGRAAFANADTKAVIGGPGGGGSNFRASRAVISSVADAGNNSGDPDVRHPGWILLTYDVCT